ncbi:alpha/beta hydrolase [Streptomyces showdoensis]|uniref:Hydrolase n=1 Tax=Streptomyces showdoensis TaxID=68268 RepID=A0A2P2GQG7_STREW|nr:alpha/beta hydrolase [Streptomyces showdoensis]KKZ73752.1 hydrolase [Streptomyces showdoensis]
MRSTRIASVVALGAAATLLPALTPAVASAAGTAATAGATAATSAATTSADPLARFARQKPRWSRCDAQGPAEYQCATIKVPLDYARPNGRTLDLAVSRTKATSARDRRGVLLLNPGGPGGPGLDMPLWMAPMLSDDVKKRYDLIGFDPRGVGRSSALGCGLNDADTAWQRPYKAATFEKDVRWARTVAEKCRARNGAVLPHITTRNTARDMDVVRAVLGEKKISYLGYSYGTYLGAVYTQMFPKRADRFVLDSAVDPERIWRGMIQVWAEGAEPAFARWTVWAAERNATYGLGGTPAEVGATFWALVAQADRKPIELDGAALSGDDIRLAGRGAFFDVTYASEAVVRLKAAAEGRTPAPARRGSSLAPVPPTFARTAAAPAAPVPPAVPADNMDVAFWSVVCADTRAWPRDPAQYRRDAIRDKARYPLYGDFASNIKPCAFWGPGAEPATKVGNSVGALVLQNEWDSQTPLVSGQGLRRALKGARMVTVLGGQGHGVYGLGSCADATATAYLVTGRLPAADLSCRTSPAQAHRSTGHPLPGVPQRLPIGQDRF